MVANGAVLSPQLANALARSLGHLLNGWRDHGAGRTAVCQRCGSQAVELYHDGKGVTGEAVTKPCQGQKAAGR